MRLLEPDSGEILFKGENICQMDSQQLMATRQRIQLVFQEPSASFAQARWCGAAGVDKVVTLSDHRDAAFGEAYGVLIKELRLLARAIFVVDKDGTVQYIQLVKEVTEEPDYDDVLGAVRKLA